MINNKYNIGDTVICIEWNETHKCFEVGKEAIEEIAVSEEGVSYYGKELCGSCAYKIEKVVMNKLNELRS